MQQLDQCFLQRIAFYFEGGEKLKQTMGSGPVRQAVKGCRGAGWFKGTTILWAGRQAGRQQRNKSVDSVGSAAAAPAVCFVFLFTTY